LQHSALGIPEYVNANLTLLTMPQKKPCLEVLEVVDSSVQKLREISESKHFCQKVTQAKMLALLKKTFIEPVEAGGVALRDRILSMEDGFEYLLNTRSAEASLSGLSQMYNLCTGRVFSTTFQTDPDFVTKLAEVSSRYTSYPYFALYGDDDNARLHLVCCQP
jgi:hypothetical protein